MEDEAVDSANDVADSGAPKSTSRVIGGADQPEQQRPLGTAAIEGVGQGTTGTSDGADDEPGPSIAAKGPRQHERQCDQRFEYCNWRPCIEVFNHDTPYDWEHPCQCKVHADGRDCEAEQGDRGEQRIAPVNGERDAATAARQFAF